MLAMDYAADRHSCPIISDSGSNEWCFFGKKGEGFPGTLIYCDFRVVEGRSVLICPAGKTAFFHDPMPLFFYSPI